MENKFNSFSNTGKRQEENYFRCDDFIPENFFRAEKFRAYALQSFNTLKDKCKDVKAKKYKSRYVDKYKSINI